MKRFAGRKAEVVRIARSQLGVSESPPNSNRNPYGKWFGWDGVAWCAIFLSWVFDRAGNRLPPISNSMGAAYVPTIKSHAEETGQWRGRSYDPKPGDLIVFWFTNRPDHVAVVAEKGRMADGRVHTIEGNSNAGGSRTGGSVVELYRRSGIHGFVAVDDTPPVQQIDWAALRRWEAGVILEPLQAMPYLHPRVPAAQAPWVKILQRTLNVLRNAGLVVDGVYGHATTLHVIAWQEDCRAFGLPMPDTQGEFGAYSKWWAAAAVQNIRDGKH